jgi:hypothetical protein
MSDDLVGMDLQQSTGNPLYRAFLAICPQGKANDFAQWVRGMASTYRLIHKAPADQPALVDWLERTRMASA